MISVIKCLLFRLKRTKMFWVMLGVCVVLPLVTLGLNLVLLKLLDVIGEEIGFVAMEEVVYTCLAEIPQISSSVALLTLFCVSIFLAKEFSNGTIRNMILSNKSRDQTFFAFYIVGSIIGGSFLIVNFASTLLSLAIPFGFGESATFGSAVGSCMSSLLLGVLAILFVVSCVTMFLFATGKQSLAIILPLLVTIFLPNLIASAVDIVMLVVQLLNIADPGTVTTIDTSWIPLYNALEYNPQTIDGGLVVKIALYYAVFIAGFTALGTLAMRKRDLN